MTTANNADASDPPKAASYVCEIDGCNRVNVKLWRFYQGPYEHFARPLFCFKHLYPSQQKAIKTDDRHELEVRDGEYIPALPVDVNDISKGLVGSAWRRPVASLEWWNKLSW